ncbi:TRAP transporter substrate-binding protein [Roseomonas indoligenes]|uniref:TRAP transporter substrate-binding protein n=1 Tax=Roseomonas indoligenes TaxID=2820811 RepID=A0A940MSI5_9PROT|nr:TRAP transporter substrate-binding protein [Pararoseomonas indoligenes]MBP0492634.1 TRAP transporter substrate-binding protein [Pararoseomonas indoligenes]
MGALLDLVRRALRAGVRLAGAAALLPAMAVAAPQGDGPVRLQVVGGLAGVSQYTRFEEPFWTKRLPEITGGRVTADVAPFDRSGIRGQEALRLLRLGVTPFGTALLNLVAAEEPELSALDTPGVSPDMATLRRVIASNRPWLQSMLRERHETELLAVYVYPAQVFFCARPFASLLDLRGRRIRTSSAAQSEWVAALGAVPVVIPFADIVPSIRAGVVECAITGTLSGWQIGLNEVTSHVHAMALTWGVSLFGANRAYWEGLPAPLQETLRQELGELEQRIWDASEAETGLGLACNTGQPTCPPEQMTGLAGSGSPRSRGRMTLVQVTPEDDALRRRLVREVILPRWADHCGPGCAEGWNDRAGDALGVAVTATR